MLSARPRYRPGGKFKESSSEFSSLVHNYIIKERTPMFASVAPPFRHPLSDPSYLPSFPCKNR